VDQTLSFEIFLLDCGTGRNKPEQMLVSIVWKEIL